VNIIDRGLPVNTSWCKSQ